MAPNSHDLLWEPTPEIISGANVTRFVALAAERLGRPVPDYLALWEWSVADLDGFWTAVADFFDVTFHQRADRVLADDRMPGARWFPGATLNYAEHVVRHRGTGAALVWAGEEGEAERTVSWDELAQQVGSFAAALQEMGVGPGDRVVGLLPNIPEAVIAFLGAASVGAVWGCCGPDMALQAVSDRLGQLAPSVLVTCNGYRYGGRVHAAPMLGTLLAAMPSVGHVVTVEYPGHGVPGAAPPSVCTHAWAEVTAGADGVAPVPVAFDHPLWVLFTSGTTGLPKGIVHGHGGIVLEHMKVLGLHGDVRPQDRLGWYTSTSWMMWNYVVGALLHGATTVLYDGSPAWPTPDAWWRVAERTGATLLGTSPGYLLGCRKQDAGPGRSALPALRGLGVTGSPLPAPLARWTSEQLGGRVPVQSVSGGTDVCSAFLAGLPTLPVIAGELQCRALGAAVEAWDEDGRPVLGEMGELVVTRPMPSMPVQLWGDHGDAKYLETYFWRFPGVWRHGDWVTLLPDGGAVVHGRSDSTLNRQGVRSGTSELYQAVESMDEVAECLAIGLDAQDGSYEVVLFVALAGEGRLDPALETAIRQAVRTKVSPRHVPDHVVAVTGIPHTLTGKKLEVPVKRILAGEPQERAFSRGAVDRPELLDEFLAWAESRDGPEGGRRGGPGGGSEGGPGAAATPAQP